MAVLDQPVRSPGEAESASDDRCGITHPLLPQNKAVSPFEEGQIDRLKANSFKPMSQSPDLLVRTVPMAKKYSAGKTRVRQVKVDPASRFETSDPEQADILHLPHQGFWIAAFLLQRLHMGTDPFLYETPHQIDDRFSSELKP